MYLASNKTTAKQLNNTTCEYVLCKHYNNKQHRSAIY